MKPLVSIILPFFNAEKTLEQAVQSVLDQAYDHWELWCINDGSSDGSLQIVEQYSDPRIHLITQTNAGVSAARNRGLQSMTGDFFCFLDADDQLLPNSLEARLPLFDDPEVEFVDGAVQLFSDDNGKDLAVNSRSFSGNPFEALLSLDESCFFGPTWMIRRREGKTYQFKEGLTHSEDLLFYLSISSSGEYRSIPSPVYRYRTGNVSAMSDLGKLDRGYQEVANELASWKHVSDSALAQFKKKTTSIMSKSYIKGGQLQAGIKRWLRKQALTQNDDI
ncbi:glycosyltransferase family 2 protein [Sanyastnella coralliicola]|uniref:glycosyltransferase family 2 protein n=1 Tax=Sanyastnella coralliicola TaxID=3069118 RepID=UPI0027B9067D|nr:glycosyltransferase family 2 protein [Longitalea sp. SCSIO 12813]